MSKRPHFTTAVIRELRDRAGNCCSNPDCARPTSGPAKDAKTGSVNIGVASHICAAMPGGPRYDSALDDDVRHSIDNGIWLCEFCAALIDKNDGAGYSIMLLMGWKQRAETNARKALERPVRPVLEAMPDIQAVSYVNVPRLIDMGQRRGISTAWPLLKPDQWLHDLGIETRVAMQAAQVITNALSLDAIPLRDLARISGDATGLIVSFKERFFTKNGPRLEDSRSKVYPLDNWSKAPHLHVKIDGRKFVLVYDPRWLTSGTSFVEVHGGQTTFSGLAVLKKAHPDDDPIIASPIVLGWPKPQFDIYEEFNRHVRGKS